MNRSWHLIITFIVLHGCIPGNSQQVHHLDEAALQKMIKQNKITLVDVRTQEEYATGHLEGAINVDFFSPTFLDRMKELDTGGGPIVLYCAKGVRSNNACNQLIASDFAEIYNLKSGYLGWTRAGLNVVK